MSSRLRLLVPVLLFSLIMLALVLAPRRDSHYVHTKGRYAIVGDGRPSSRFKALVLPLNSKQQHPGKGIIREVLDYRGVFRDVYTPKGYSICYQAGSNPSAPLCWPRLHKAVDCRALFKQYLFVLQHHKPVFPAPKKLPAGQLGEFLLQGYTELSSFYVSQQADYGPGSETPVWEASYINGLVQKARARTTPFGSYGGAVEHVYQALDCHPIKGQHGAVFGSEIPWLEAVLFAFGAGQLTTIEFRATVTKAADHEVLSPADWAYSWLNSSRTRVDFAWSFSSWEHDGLARYGDPVHPWGDVAAMQRASCYVKPDGLLFFGAPSSAFDQIMFNAHRIYGPARLPLLTADWEVVGVYDGTFSSQCGAAACDGLFSSWAHKAPPKHYGFQPVIVLKNQRATPCST